MPIDPNLAFGFRPTPNIGPNMGTALQDFDQILGLQQKQQAANSQNALRDTLGAPGAIGADGNPTANTLAQLAGSNPDAWLKIRESQLSMQRQQAQMQEYQTKRAEDIQALIDPARSAALQAYTTTDGPPEAKLAAGQKALEEGLNDLTKGGGLSAEEAAGLNRKFDPVRMGMMSAQWQQHLKDQAARADKQRDYDLDVKKAGQTEKHQDNEDQAARNKPIPMLDTGNKAADGTPMPYLLYPNPAPGAPHATTLDGLPYSPKGMQRVGTTDTAPLAVTPEEREAAAAQATTGQPLTQIAPGYGKAVAERREQIHADAIKKIMDKTGMNAADAGIELANKSIEFVAGGKTTGQLTEMQGATRQAVGQLDYNIGKVTEEMAKLKSSNLSPIINAIIRKDEQWTGDPAYAGLYLYMNAAATESARIMSGGQASKAQLQVGAAEEAKKWANVNMTPNMWTEVSKAMHDEGLNRVQTYGDAIRQQRVGTGAAGAQGGQAPPPPPPAKDGATDNFYRGDTPPANHPEAKRSPKDGKWYFQQGSDWYAVSGTATAPPAKDATPAAGQQAAQPTAQPANLKAPDKGTLANAKAAIAKGAPRDAIIKKLADHGYNSGDL